eukprot:COSAG02_NODE_12_length_58022_cov_242.077379_18_plen_72_part_00
MSSMLMKAIFTRCALLCVAASQDSNLQLYQELFKWLRGLLAADQACDTTIACSLFSKLLDVVASCKMARVV